MVLRSDKRGKIEPTIPAMVNMILPDKRAVSHAAMAVNLIHPSSNYEKGEGKIVERKNRRLA